MQKISGPLFLALLASSPLAHTCINGTGFLPENDLRIPIHAKTTGLSREQYDAVIDKVEKVYSPIAQKYGALLKIDRKWESDVVNAGTYQDEGGAHWHINLYGGFARHPEITEDGFALVICHEIGHHIGGAPKKKNSQGETIWASTEGQSDYFATLKCLRRVFAKEDNQAAIKDQEIPQNVREECTRGFPTEWEAALCMRTSLAGLAVTKVNADSRRVPHPDLTQQDFTVVEGTVDHHPRPQCRLDTYFQGSVCEVPSTRYVSQKDERLNTCHPQLGHSTGLRPACWYKAKE